MGNKLGLDKQVQLIKRHKLNLMRIAAKASVNFFKNDNFNAQGFIDNGVEKWEPRKSGGTRKILVKTGRGRASIREERVTDQSATITVVDYMAKHNEGQGQVQRKFAGTSKSLDKRVLKEFDQYVLNNILK